jgi:dolichol-phosphate mannosyltransferase
MHAAEAPLRPSQGPSPIRLSVVIPIHDEAPNIEALLAEIDTSLGETDFEVICVNDGSTDGTAPVLEAARRRFVWLRCLAHRERYGQSYAMRSGVRAARAPVVATLDGDGQNDPADLPPLLAAFEALGAGAGPRLAIGWRRDRKDSALRKLAGRVANAVRGKLLGDPCPDSGCGLRVFERDAFLELPFFDHMHRFLPTLIVHAGGRIAVVPVKHRPRAGGRSKYGINDRLWVGIFDLLGVLWLKRRTRVTEVDEV